MRNASRINGVVAAMAAAAAAGCATGITGASDEPATFSTAELIAHFEESTGHRLVVANRFESRPIISGWDSLEPVRPLDEFGRFDVGVFYDIKRSKREGLLDGLTPTGAGVYWIEHVPERADEARSWSAMKLYSNVQLTWPSKTKKLDDRWRRLDAVFSELGRKR